MAACWACPALPMLPLPLKETGRVSFLGVKPMISAHYEENPDSFHEEIKQLDQLRENAMRPSRDYNGISTLRRYFAQLHLLRARFPPETIGQLPIDFVWKDIFSGAEYIQEGLQIEQASILYNISALHSALGCRSKRDLEQEIKESITHFQCAAGACNYLDEHLSMNHASKDISPPFIQFYKNLMLGQAQECFVEKSLRGSAKVKNSTIAKLSTRVAEYYSETLRCLETEPCSVIAKKHKDWPKLLKLKALYFQALSHYYQGDTCEETGQQGSMMAWHQLALKKLTAIGRVPKNLGEGTVLKEAIKNFSEHVQAKLAVSKKQNEQVYHERIPDLETLESFSGTDLVKPVVFHPTDSKNLGTDIFGRLVPMRAYEASSIYSERKADMLRSITSSVSEKDEELERFLKTLNIEEVESINKGPPDISGEVLEQHKQLQGKSLVVKKLHADLQELMGYSEMVKKDLQDISKHRMEDEEEEKEFQRKFGPRPASQVCASMWKDLETYKRYHEQGVRL